MVNPSPLAWIVIVVPLRVSVNAPDSAAIEIKSVVVGFETRFVDPAAVGAPPFWFVAELVEIVCSAVCAASLAVALRLVLIC